MNDRNWGCFHPKHGPTTSIGYTLGEKNGQRFQIPFPSPLKDAEKHYTILNMTLK
jgi:hypothetical protein